MSLKEPFWIEVDLSQLKKNIQLIRNDMPKNLRWCSVLKNQAYGHGVAKIAQEMVTAGADLIAVSNVEEAAKIKLIAFDTPVLIFGERTFQEIEFCIENNFIFFVNDVEKAKVVHEIGSKHGKKVDVQFEIDTGLSRYGVRWTEAVSVIDKILDFPNINIVGVMTHFAMSDELDKTFANEQIRRFDEFIAQVKKIRNLSPDVLFHACNTGGYLDLPKAHYDMVRIGILPLGIYPSKVCRRIDGIKPILSFKTYLASIKKIEPGDAVGYGMHYKANSKRTIAVLPVGYGTGYPRLRNQGHVLSRGKQAPVVGGNAMNAMMIDITDILEAKIGDEIVLLGSQGKEEITAVEIADWRQTVCYDILTRLSSQIPRLYKN